MTRVGGLQPRELALTEPRRKPRMMRAKRMEGESESERTTMRSRSDESERGERLPHVIYQLSPTADMTTLNTDTDTGILATSTPQHGGDALFGDNLPQGIADIGLDLVGSAYLDSSALAPPQSDPSSSKVPVPDVNNASGSKRKLEDRDSASDTESRAHDRKKLKQESPDERTSSLITPRHMADIAGIESLVGVCDVYWQLPLLTLGADVSAI